MSTRSRIGIVSPNGPVQSIYCHWDGYPEHHWPILTKHYKTYNMARRLIDLGDLSILGRRIGTKIPFDVDEQTRAHRCVAYGRDRGDSDASARYSDDRLKFYALCRTSGAEYAYLFDEGAWSVFSMRGNGAAPVDPARILL